MTRDEAAALIEEALPDENLRKHVYAVEAVMRALARKLGGDEQAWGLAGLLHDIDYAQTKDDPARHALPGAAKLRELGVDEDVVTTVLAHADKAPQDTPMRRAIVAADPVTGFIVACALVRPDKKLASVQVKSLKKRWREKRFAAGADRGRMAMHEQLGLERDEYLTICLEAMKDIAPQLGL